MKILYIVDAINYLGGANVATASLVSELLNRGVEVDVLTDSVPTAETQAAYHNAKIISRPLRRWNFSWFVRGLIKKIFRVYYYPNWAVDPGGGIRELMRKYDCVCVMSELSSFRKLVCGLPDSVRKVQMIHSDYVWMRRFDKHAKAACKLDRFIYRKMNVLCVIGKVNADRMARAFPEFRGKISYFYNVIPSINEKPSTFRRTGGVHIVSAFSLDSVAKDPARVVRLALRLVSLGVDIEWTIFGDGMLRSSLLLEVERHGMQDKIHLPGKAHHLMRILSHYDFLVLCSHYEGLPMVIYEALMAGIPVFSTNVGGVSEQITDGVNGWLVEDDEERIFKKLQCVALNHSQISKAKRNLASYKYDNERAIQTHLEALGLGGQC